MLEDSLANVLNIDMKTIVVIDNPKNVRFTFVSCFTFVSYSNEPFIQQALSREANDVKDCRQSNSHSVVDF